MINAKKKRKTIEWERVEISSRKLETPREHFMQVSSVSSVAQPCPTICNPMDCNTPGFPVHHQLPELAQTHVLELVMPSNHLILCHPLLLLPSIFPSIRDFSKESVPCIKWPKYWNFSFSISPSNEYSRLISFTIDWFDLLAVQGTLEFSPTPRFMQKWAQ